METDKIDKIIKSDHIDQATLDRLLNTESEQKRHRCQNSPNRQFQVDHFKNHFRMEYMAIVQKHMRLVTSTRAHKN